MVCEGSLSGSQGSGQQGLTDSTAPPAWHGPQCLVPLCLGAASLVGAEAELWGKKESLVPRGCSGPRGRGD